MQGGSLENVSQSLGHRRVGVCCTDLNLPHRPHPIVGVLSGGATKTKTTHALVSMLPEQEVRRNNYLGNQMPQNNNCPTAIDAQKIT